MVSYEIGKNKEILLIKDSQTKYKIDLNERLFNFAIETIKILGQLPSRKEYDVFRYQLSRSATSIGANYEEAQGAYSKKEFASKIGICLKESRESYYFYKMIRELKIGDISKIRNMVVEAEEIKKIFASILIKVKDRG